MSLELTSPHNITINENVYMNNQNYHMPAMVGSGHRRNISHQQILDPFGLHREMDPRFPLNFDNNYAGKDPFRRLSRPEHNRTQSFTSFAPQKTDFIKFSPQQKSRFKRPTLLDPKPPRLEAGSGHIRRMTAITSETQPSLHYNNYLGNSTEKYPSPDRLAQMTKNQSNDISFNRKLFQANNSKKNYQEEDISKLEQDLYTKLGFPTLNSNTENYFGTPQKPEHEYGRTKAANSNYGENSTFWKTHQRVTSSPIRSKNLNNFKRAIDTQEKVLQLQRKGRGPTPSDDAITSTERLHASKPLMTPKEPKEPNKGALKSLQKILNMKDLKFINSKTAKNTDRNLEQSNQLSLAGEFQKHPEASSLERIYSKLDKRLESIENRITDMETLRSPMRKDDVNDKEDDSAQEIAKPNCEHCLRDKQLEEVKRMDSYQNFSHTLPKAQSINQSGTNINLLMDKPTDMESLLTQCINLHSEIFDVTSESEEFSKIHSPERMFEDFNTDLSLDFLYNNSQLTKNIKIGK